MTLCPQKVFKLKYVCHITLCEMLGWMNHKLESRLLGEISIASDMQVIPLVMAESEEALKSLLMKVRDETEKAHLQHSIKK